MPLFILIALLYSSSSFAEIDRTVQKEFLKSGGAAKALSHLNCFLKNYRQTVFDAKTSGLTQRCNRLESGDSLVSLNRHHRAVIVDYTKPSTQKRFYILDLSSGSPQKVQRHYVSHGRFGNTPRSNTRPGKERNTVKAIKYYSNVKGSNASSTGFSITGHKYQGRWTGPKGDKNSLVLHGIEKGLNDNHCDRAIVIHGNSYIREKGQNRGVRRMSSGCYMLDYRLVNSVVEDLRGMGGPLHPEENKQGGIVFFTYGPREAALSEDHYCLPETRKSFRIAK